MGAGGAGSGGGNTGPDQGFFNSQAAKDKKANDDAAKRGNPDYQGELSSKSKNKGNNNNNNNNGGGNDGNNTITQVTNTAPTVSEVSQATTTEADTEANRLLKIKKKGRSQSIISGSKGVTVTASDYSLGKKSLLGRV